MALPQRMLLALAINALVVAGAFADDAEVPATDPPTGPVPTRQLETIEVTTPAERSRSQLQPDIGSSIYHFSTSDIDALPLGSDTPLNQVILQSPGVVQDSFGQLHVRGDHANLQYRIDGVVVPEPITGFGQGFDARFAKSIDLLTGALPAQYGYRTAGVIDILTKGAAMGNGGSVTGIIGTNGFAEAGAQAFGTSGDWSAFVEADTLHTDLGIENPTSSRNALHDASTQTKSFADISRALDADSRVSLIVGTSLGHFQIPDRSDQVPPYTLAGSPELSSSQLNARQDETNDFQVLTYQSNPTDKLDYQLSIFHRTTSVHYEPDEFGDLEFLGVAAHIQRDLESSGLQGDAGYQVSDAHTVRAGYFAEYEHFTADNTAQAFPADGAGMQTSSTPETIIDNSRLAGTTAGVYLQDEWRLSKDLTLNYGARYDTTDTVTDEDQLSPRIGLVYDLSASTHLHMGFARYFTPPPTEIIGTTDIARFANTTNALPGDSNTAVKAERSNYFDAGLEQQINADWSVGVDAYFRRVNNLQDEGQFGNALIYSAFNYREGRVGGLELSTTYKHGIWSGYANLAINQAEGRDIVTGQYNFSSAELAYISDHWIHLDHDQTVTASGGLAYRAGDTTYSADWLFGSGLRSGFANTDHLPAYTQVNLNAVQKINAALVGHMEIRLTLVNLFDRVYELRDGTGVGVGAPQYGPRRGVMLGATKYF
jgi:outer membrane receptor protein involved in Fe transport